MKNLYRGTAMTLAVAAAGAILPAGVAAAASPASAHRMQCPEGQIEAISLSGFGFCVPVNRGAGNPGAQHVPLKVTGHPAWA